MSQQKDCCQAWGFFQGAIDMICCFVVAWMAVTFWPLAAIWALVSLFRMIGQGLRKEIAADWKGIQWPGLGRLLGLAAGALLVLGAIASASYFMK